MLFAYNIILIDETMKGINNKLGWWTHNLKSRGFKLSRSKTKYLRCDYNGGEEGSGDGDAILKVDKFKYLGLSTQEKGDIDE